MCIICVMCIIFITFSAWVSFWKPKFQKIVNQMKEFLVSHGNLPDNCSIGQVPATKDAISQKT